MYVHILRMGFNPLGRGGGSGGGRGEWGGGGVGGGEVREGGESGAGRGEWGREGKKLLSQNNTSITVVLLSSEGDHPSLFLRTTLSIIV